MHLGQLAPAVALQRLRQGVRLRTGPFVVALRSDIAALSQQVLQQYAEHELAEDDGFSDFHIRITPPAGLRRWWRPQARFVFDGAEHFNPLPLHHAFPLLEWGLNWCVSMHAHQYVILHAAVLERGGRAVVLPAPSGSGKSTLCAALAHRGWRLLSDELALLGLEDGLLWPLTRPISLKNQSIRLIRDFAPDARIGEPVPDTIKGAVAHCAPPAAAVRAAQTPARPGWIVLPRYTPDAPAALTPLPKAQAVMELIDACFNYSIHRHQGFAALGRLVDGSDCHRFEYSRLEDAIAVFDRLAEADPDEPSVTPTMALPSSHSASLPTSQSASLPVSQPVSQPASTTGDAAP